MSKFNSSLGKTYYVKKGKKTREPMVIGVHGGPGGFHQTVLPLLKLQTGRQVVLYDQIGTGRSQRIPREKWVIESFTRNLRDLIEHLGEESFFLHGSSWGTTLILEYCKEYGFDGLKGIIFQSPMFSAARWMADAEKLKLKLSNENQKIINYCEEIGATDSKVYEKAMWDFYGQFLFRKKETKEHLLKYLKLKNEEMYQHMWGPSEFKSTGTLKEYDQTKFLKEITIPVLYTCGEYDEATPATCRDFQKMTPNSTLNIIKGAAHQCLLDEWVQYSKILSAFLRKNR